MHEEILHQRESSAWSEQFLKDNGEKFAKQAVDVLRLLYSGMRLTAMQTNQILNIADGGRRLREIFAARKECKKDKRITNGKVEGVEYWLDVPAPPSKHEVIERATKVIEMFKRTNGLLEQGDLFTNP